MITCSKCGTPYDGAEIFCPKDGTRLIAGTERHKLASIPPEDTSLIGKTIQGRYKVLSHLGAGGMGVVYIAEHVEIQKKVALKVLRDDFSKRPEVVERFRQEARAASRIGNPHIVDVTDFGQMEDGGVYFTMEYLQGESLSEMIQDKIVPVEIAIPITVQIAKALQAAHDLGIVHRDLKPENVFLVDREEQKHFVKVLDFGIAKISDRDSEGKRLTQTGMIFGTPEYMSPEQATGKPLDHRVDVYALGCILYEMFVGHVPFDGDSFMAVLTQHMFEPVPKIEDLVPNTEVPESIRNIVYKAMAKDVDNRYADMKELENELQKAFVDENYVVPEPARDVSMRMSARTKGPQDDWDIGNSETKMDWSASSETTVAKDKSKKGLYIGAALGVIAILVAVVFLSGILDPQSDKPKTEIPVVANQGPDTTGQQEPDTQPPQTEDTQQDTASTEKDAGQADSVPAEVEKISVTIKSTPKGATLSIGDLGQVCSATPCELELEIGKPVEFQAKLGRKKAKITFTPSSQNKELTLKLKGGGGGKPSGGGNNNSDSSNNQNNDSELKIPGIFKDN